MASVSIKDLNPLSLLVLYVINQAENGIPDETHYQKIMFQTMKILKNDPADVGFRAHYFGPYSDTVDECRSSLKSLGFVCGDGGKVTIEPSEKKSVSEIKPPTEEIGFRIHDMVDELCRLKNDELLLMIYHDDLRMNNGRYVENSHVREDIMRNRIPIAVRMYRSKKVTFGRATELAGLDVRDFENELIERHGVAYVN